MTAIGGKHKIVKSDKPQIMVQRGINEFAKLGADDEGHATIAWAGDPNAATKFDSKYAAKFRTREFTDVEGCSYKELA